MNGAEVILPGRPDSDGLQSRGAAGHHAFLVAAHIPADVPLRAALLQDRLINPLPGFAQSQRPSFPCGQLTTTS